MSCLNTLDLNPCIKPLSNSQRQPTHTHSTSHNRALDREGPTLGGDHLKISYFVMREGGGSWEEAGRIEDLNDILIVEFTLDYFAGELEGLFGGGG